MKTPLVFLCAVLVASSCFAGDVSWLDDVTSPPVKVPEPDRPLRPLMENAKPDGQDARKAWQARRSGLKQEWLEFLGPLPQGPGEIKLEVLSVERLERCTRSLVRYEAEPGRVIDAYLLRPFTQESEKKPAIVVFHGTTTETINSVAGTGERPEKFFALRLAERGFVTLCPKNFLWEEADYNASVAAVKQRHPKSLGMATMLADGMRAVDVLHSLPDVDPNRIGAMGHSLGAKEVLYLMAFDERVKAGVASEGGVGLNSTNWDAPWYLGPGIEQADFKLNHHELLALTAPRPMLVFGGESGRGAADGDRSWPYLVAAQEIYRLYGEPIRLGLLNHRQGHQLSPEFAERAFEWLEVYLKQ